MDSGSILYFFKPSKLAKMKIPLFAVVTAIKLPSLLDLILGAACNINIKGLRNLFFLKEIEYYN